MKIGDRVSIVFYGEPRTGTVERIGERSGMLFVRMDGTDHLSWFFPESCKPIEQVSVSDPTAPASELDPTAH